MRVLVLCDRVPDGPVDGLLLRLLALARELAPRHELDLLCLRSRPGVAAPAGGIFRRVWCVAPGARRPRARWIGPLVGWDPADLYPKSDEARALLEGELDPARYDVVWDAGAVLFAQMPPRWQPVPVVADLVDDMVLTYRRAMKSAPGALDRLRLWKACFVFARFERTLMRRVAHCVVVGEDDAASFARVSPAVPVTVVGNGVDTSFYRPGLAPEVPGRIVFEGSMGFAPNERAAVHLVREVMPRVWQARPDATVALVGRDPGPAVRGLAGERVFVTGSVPDVREHVAAAEVFACPLLDGAGIKNKLLQAWAMERAVVATPMAIGGLQARDGVDLLVRDAAADFAAAVVELLADGHRRRALGRAGRMAAQQRFAWAAMAARLERLLEQAAASRSGLHGAGPGGAVHGA